MRNPNLTEIEFTADLGLDLTLPATRLLMRLFSPNILAVLMALVIRSPVTR